MTDAGRPQRPTRVGGGGAVPKPTQWQTNAKYGSKSVSVITSRVLGGWGEGEIKAPLSASGMGGARERSFEKHRDRLTTSVCEKHH